MMRIDSIIARTAAVMLFCLVPVLFLNAESTAKDAETSCSRSDGKVTCEIVFHAPFRLNKKAPFKFFLLPADKGKGQRVPVDDFTCHEHDDDVTCSYTVSSRAEKYRYWFVACKHRKGKIVACKTFSGTEKITQGEQ